MATREEYLAQGKTPEQIDAAIVNKNSQAIGQKLGQEYNQTTGQFNAPVAPVAPTPTPQVVAPTTAPQQTPEQANIAKGLSPFGQPISPESPQPIASTAPQQEKTTVQGPDGTTTTTKETPVDQGLMKNAVENRQREIVQNLNEGYANDPTVNKAITTGDYDTFKQAYNYDTSDETKKQTLDAYFQARQPKDESGIYQILKTGQKIANPAISSSPAFNTAQTKFNIFNRLNGMDSSQLLTEMKNNNVGSEMDKELMLNPQYQLAKQKYNQFLSTKAINDKSLALANAVGGKGSTAPDAVSKLNNQIVSNLVSSGKTEDQLGTYREYLAKNNPELVGKVSELNAKNKSLKELADARDDMYKSVIADRPGISKGAAIALAAKMNEPINEQIKSASYELEQLASDIKYQQAIAEKDYDYLVKEQDKEEAIEQQMAQEERQFGRQIQLAEFQNELQAAQEERQFEKQKEMADIQNKYQESRDVTQYRQDLQKMGISDAMQTNRDKLNFAQQKELSAIQNKYQSSRDVQNYERDIAKMNFQYDTDPNAIAQKIENAKAEPKGFLSILGDGKITGYGGAYDGFKGLDVDGKKGDPVYGFNGKIVSIIDANFQSSPYGNSVVVEDNQGNQIRLSHLDSINVKPGQTISETDMIGALGNTGNVIPGKGGDGSHLDIRVKQAGAKTEMPSKQVEQFLRGYGKTEEEPITDKQFTQYNQMYSKFQADKSVQAFESALNGGGDLIASLKSANGPGDVGAVFGFMKSLDPQSVVKEGEFELAAKSAGVWEQFKNIPANKLEGAILTDAQRKAFGKLAFEYIKSKSKIYDVKYNDMAKVLRNQNIPESYMPTKMSDLIDAYEKGEPSQQSQIKSTTGQTYSKEELLNALR